jgi:hypothetical protein
MNSPIEPNTLDEVLDAYTLASQIPNREILIEYIHRYPQFERELIDYTMTWMGTNHLPSPAEMEPEDTSFIQLGMAAAQQAFHQQDEIKRTNSPFHSILEESKSSGISIDQFASMLNLSILLMRKIDLRAIAYHTIPFEIIQSFADNLKRNVREIARYLTLPPMQPTTARYKSSKAPKLDEQRSFFDEVREDHLLSEEQRQYWLSKESKDHDPS